MEGSGIVLLILGAVNLLLFFFTLIQLLFILRRARQLQQEGVSFNGPKIFYVVIMLTFLVRGSFFIVETFALEGTVTVGGNGVSTWAHSAEILFFFNYFMLFLLWMNFYYTVSSTIDRGNSPVRSILMCGMCIFSVILIPTFFLLEILGTALMLDVEKLNSYVSVAFGSLELLVSLGFVYYAICLILTIKESGNIPDELIRRIKQVSFVSAICTLCFTVRAVTTFLFLVRNEDFFTNGYFFHTSPFVMLAYFASLEIVPTCLIVYLLTQLPDWKVQDVEEERNSMYEAVYDNEMEGY